MKQISTVPVFGRAVALAVLCLFMTTAFCAAQNNAPPPATSGSKVLLQHKATQEEQECHVAFLGPVRAGKAEIGLEFSSPRPAFWRVTFPPADWSPKHPEARTAISTVYPKK